MKKKIILFSIILLCVVCITGCGKSASSGDDKKASDILNQSSTSKKSNSDSKVLVVYFSKTGENYNVGTVDVGNTAMMASYIVDYLKADSFEIVPVKKYSDNYQKSTEEAKKEQNENARPEIKNKLENLEEYDTVFLGYPIWWGDLPMVVYTFLEEYNFDGKAIIPFNTHEGSGSAGTYQSLKDKMTKSTVNTNGLAITGSRARTEEGKKDTIDWLKELGY
ncbi:MAG: NAD(P)H-dependent oxidoreductase [Bacilli bacterium]|nr:NAD(P)H-dependent oxidoreductase [Bacilli bacterium]